MAFVYAVDCSSQKFLGFWLELHLPRKAAIMDTQQLQEVIDKIHELRASHRPTKNLKKLWCLDCSQNQTEPELYPCPTVIACDIVQRVYDLGKFAQSPISKITVEALAQEILYAIGYGFSYDVTD